MKKTMLCAAVCAVLAPAAFAQSSDAAAAAPAEHTFTGNVAVVSDYRFRGISQTFKQPAIQGGFDYSHSSGFYLGNWNSSLSGLQYPNGAGVEMDFYGGYKFEVAPELMADVGLLYYYYPGAYIDATGNRFNNGEFYVGASYKWLTAKYSYGLTDFFGLDNSKGSGYLDLGANFEIAPKTTLNLHVGRQWVRHNGDLNYTDYKVGVSYDLGFATAGLAVIGTDADKALYSIANSNGKTKNLGKTGAVLSLSKTF